MSCLAAAGKIHRRSSPPVTQQSDGANQRPMVFLCAEAGDHQQRGFAARESLLGSIAEGRKVDTVGNDGRALGGKPQLQKARQYAGPAADDARRSPCQPTRLRQSPAGIAFARIVFDVHQGGHAGKQSGISTPQVLAETVRDQYIWPMTQTKISQRDDGRDICPTRDGLDREPALQQFLDTLRPRVPFAPEHEQWLDGIARERRCNELNGNLRGPATEAATDEVQYSNLADEIRLHRRAILSACRHEEFPAPHSCRVRR